MACKPNELIINRSCSVKLTDDIYFIITAQYHTAEKGTDDKSFYHLAGRIATKEQLANDIKQMSLDENKLNDWHWGDSRFENYYISYNKRHDNEYGATFLTNKINKVIGWDEFYTLATKGIRIVGGKNPREKYSEASKYELTDWETVDGKSFDIESPDSLIPLVGEYVIHRQPLKRDLKEKLISELTK